MKKNIYGLSRNIPLDVSDEVRRRSHYGCVICGEIPYQFEHIEPEFKDAVEHNANNITLLCPTCHTKVTNGIISKLVVKKATLNPYCKSNGYNFMGLAPSFNDFTFSFGNAKFVKPRFPIILNGIPIVAVNYDMRRETILLNCKFFDRLGHLVAEVIDNEWKTFIDGVDIKLIRKTLTVKRLNEKILSVTFEESNVIRVDYMHMNILGNIARVDETHGCLMLLSLKTGVFFTIDYRDQRHLDKYDIISVHDDGLTLYKKGEQYP